MKATRQQVEEIRLNALEEESDQPFIKSASKGAV